MLRKKTFRQTRWWLRAARMIRFCIVVNSPFLISIGLAAYHQSFRSNVLRGFAIANLFKNVLLLRAAMWYLTTHNALLRQGSRLYGTRPEVLCSAAVLLTPSFANDGRSLINSLEPSARAF